MGTCTADTKLSTAVRAGTTAVPGHVAKSGNLYGSPQFPSI
eukprot:SAG31_NODE_7625_length_1636_cov_1.796357_2_plen_40_part_01